MAHLNTDSGGEEGVERNYADINSKSARLAVLVLYKAN